MIETKLLSHQFPLGELKVSALKDINLKIDTGEFAIIAGPSGSGKTTFLNIIGLILKPDNGDVMWFNQNAYNDKKVTEELRRNDLGYIFQTFNLIPVLTVYENVEYFLLKKNFSKIVIKEKIEQMLIRVGLKDHIKKYPWQLSGGQRQRVAIARALVKEPKVLLADEPTANLDHATGSTIIELLKEINERDKTTVVIATHDNKVIKEAKRVIYFEDGKIIN